MTKTPAQHIAELIKAYALQPHPEGGYYAETYRSHDRVMVSERYRLQTTAADIPLVRPSSTAILFLLTSENFSQFHRIKSDEIWAYHEGSPLRITMIDNKTGALEQYVLGKLSQNSEAKPQLIIPHGVWFAAEVIERHAYGLVTCFVSPGFVFDDFELAPRSDLCAMYPQHAETIRCLTKEVEYEITTL